ncbi:ACP S-malonyltransferase [Oligoflexia bacterium]|nr:ACP S-malonyltransferase [Oligoflexia bacterium]
MDTITKIFGLFPGQGSQKVGMGKELWEQFDLAKEMFSMADDVLGFSLSKICFEGPVERLTETEVTQPAILTVSSICYALLQNKLGSSLNLIGAAGHSLGEYSALVAAGALEFKDAVLLVHKRGKYMQKAVPVGAGAMLAVLGKELPEIEAALTKTKGIAQVANINAPGQVVIAGSVSGTREFTDHLGEARVKELAVSAPFHCQLMKPAEKELAVDLKDVNIQPAKFPVYVNYSAQATTEPEEIREALKLQVCHQVRWVACMQNAIAEVAPNMMIEFGTGNVLSGLLKRIDSSLKRAAISSPASFEKLPPELGGA